MYFLLPLLLIIFLILAFQKHKQTEELNEGFRDIPIYQDPYYLRRPVYIGKYPYYMSVFNYI